MFVWCSPEIKNLKEDEQVGFVCGNIVGVMKLNEDFSFKLIGMANENDPEKLINKETIVSHIGGMFKGILVLDESKKDIFCYKLMEQSHA